MDYMTILATAAQKTTEAAASAGSIVPIDKIWQQVTALDLLEALTFIAFGSVCLFYGWRVFKILVVICFALLGMLAGVAISSKVSGLNNQILGGAIGMAILAVTSIPLMRYSVSVLGAVAGGIITAALWYAFALNEQYIWAGALVGVVAGGMASFIVFKIAVVLFSSLGGSALMGMGMLALLNLYQPTTDQIHRMVNEQRWFLPLAFVVPTLLGLLVQAKMVKSQSESDL